MIVRAWYKENELIDNLQKWYYTKNQENNKLKCEKKRRDAKRKAFLSNLSAETEKCAHRSQNDFSCDASAQRSVWKRVDAACHIQSIARWQCF